MQIELTEHATTRGIPLPRTALDRLRRLAPQIAVTPSADGEGAYDLTPGSWIGSVHLEHDLEMLLRPKIPIDRVLFLLSYAVDPKRWREAPAHLAEAPSLLEAILPGFTYQLRRALERGPLQGYRGEDDAVPTVRGRWRIDDQLRMRFGIAPPVEVSFDDFTVDVEQNRILRAALHRLLRLPIRNDRLRWPLRAIDEKLAEVRLVEYRPGHVPEVRLDRRSERYRAAIALASLILSDLAFDLTAGAVAASAFLVDMNKLFEDFVVAALREELGVGEDVLVQGAGGRHLFLDRGRRVRLEPDLSLWSGERCIFVGDVKYKRLATGDARNADLYQLAAYTLATGLPAGLLIYAETGEPAAEYELVQTGARLEVVALDLRQTPQHLLEGIHQIAARIRKLAITA